MDGRRTARTDTLFTEEDTTMALCPICNATVVNRR